MADGEPVLTFDDLNDWLVEKSGKLLARGGAAVEEFGTYSEAEDIARVNHSLAVVRRIIDCLDELEEIHRLTGATGFRDMQYTHMGYLKLPQPAHRN